MTHPAYDYEVKSWPAFFARMITGEKKHDMRNKKDRQYKVGDKVLLREYDPFAGRYTGRSSVFKITYITSNDTPCALSSVGLDDNMAILSVERIGKVVDTARDAQPVMQTPTVTQIVVSPTDDVRDAIIKAGRRYATGGVIGGSNSTVRH